MYFDKESSVDAEGLYKTLKKKHAGTCCNLEKEHDVGQ